MQRVPAHKGMLCHLIKHARPDLVKTIEETQEVETAVVGLGRQGTRHAGLMREFGTTVTAGVAAGRSGQRVHETIPVYDRVYRRTPEYRGGFDLATFHERTGCHSRGYRGWCAAGHAYYRGNTPERCSRYPRRRT